MKTFSETRALVHELDRAAKERFDDTSIERVGRRNLVYAQARPHDRATLTALIASCDRDIAGETAAALGLGHEPRNRAVRCVVAFCGRETWAHHAACERHPIDCDRCLPWDVT